MARDEDLGAGDITAALLADAPEPAAFRLLMKQPGVFAGRELAGAVLRAYDKSIDIEWSEAATDGARIGGAPTALAVIRGPRGAVLSAERVMLNFVQRLCGVATLTRRYVDAIAGTGAAIYDTRKTTPGWRSLEKFAVRCGGGRNHRNGLHDAVLVKDNHLVGVETPRLAVFLFELLNRASSLERKPDFVEVEADTPEQAAELFKVVGIDVVLLDNFSIRDLSSVVELRDSLGLKNKVALEASGGITLETIGPVAQTGVERISVGAITHSAVALDLSLEMV